MNAGELIKQLQQVPPDAEVYTSSSDEACEIDFTNRTGKHVLVRTTDALTEDFYITNDMELGDEDSLFRFPKDKLKDITTVCL